MFVSVIYIVLGFAALYTSIMCEKSRNGYVLEGKDDEAKYMQVKSNSLLVWAMGWALLALLSVNGLFVLFSILQVVMILAFIMRL